MLKSGTLALDTPATLSHAEHVAGELEQQLAGIKGGEQGTKGSAEGTG